MKHFGGTALEQVNYRHNVAIKLDYPKFCDLIVNARERLTILKKCCKICSNGLCRRRLGMQVSSGMSDQCVK